ncbi:hypothetical protein AB0J07_13810, partial [Microbispora rosea]
MHDAFAHIGGYLATGLREVTTDLAALDGSGWWAVVVSYEGKVVCARFDVGRVQGARLHEPTSEWGLMVQQGQSLFTT